MSLLHKKLRILFILDPLNKLHPELDTSLGLLRQFHERGHDLYIADVPDIYMVNANPGVRAFSIDVRHNQVKASPTPSACCISEFDLVLVRKEPPFDAAYVYMTYILELTSKTTFISNSPVGIRNTNEKAGILRFPQHIPPTIISYSLGEITSFAKAAGKDLVIKPLGLKGGEGIFRFSADRQTEVEKLETFLENAKEPIMAQQFINCGEIQSDKRLMVLNGEIIVAYEKRAQKGEFRANISLGGTIHATEVTSGEKAMVSEMKGYLLSEGLHLVGLDVMNEKLIEINVTCPAGFMEAKELYPQAQLTEAWADFLETQAGLRR